MYCLELVDLSRRKKLLGSEWVFTINCKPDGVIDKYKMRLVVKGFTQTYGIDYLEILAPFAKLKTVKLITSLAAQNSWAS